MSSETNSQIVVLGTRRSKLAKIQTSIVEDILRHHQPWIQVQTKEKDPLGDRDKTSALYQMAAFSPAEAQKGSKDPSALAKSLWTGEFEEMLETGEVDAVVHSLKDLATQLPDRLCLAAVVKREDPRDVLSLPKSSSEFHKDPPHNNPSADEILKALPKDSIIGTSSLRRIAQLKRNYPHLKFEVLRGNVPTRLAKLDDPISQGPDAPMFSAIVIAAAGLIRLGLEDRISAFLDGSKEGGGVLHAVGQGAIGVEARDGDERVLPLLKCLEDVPTRLAITAERAMLRRLEGGCSVPVGVETKIEDHKLLMNAVVVSVDGTRAAHVEETAEVSTVEQSEKLGIKVAELLIQNGAQEILDEINKERRKAVGIYQTIQEPTASASS